MSYWIHAACNSNKGNGQQKNEDNYYFNGDYYTPGYNEEDHVKQSESSANACPVYFVFDGVGGSAIAKAAAHTAAASCSGIIRERRDENSINGIYRELNEQVLALQRKENNPWLATTAACVLFNSDRAVVANMGDSRVYRIRGGKMQQLSTDDLEDRKFVTSSGRKIKGTLTQYLGMDAAIADIEPNICEAQLQAGDSFLLCTNGLTDMVSEEKITELINGRTEAAEIVAELTQAAVKAGGRDSITIIFCHVDEKGPMPGQPTKPEIIFSDLREGTEQNQVAEPGNIKNADSQQKETISLGDWMNNKWAGHQESKNQPTK